jgi:hypothetical protein
MAASKDTATALVEILLAVLEAQRSLGKEAYPLTLQRLVELAAPQTPPEMVAKAIGKKPFKDRVVMASKKSAAGLIALAEDVAQVVSSPRLLESALETLCTPASPLWPLTKVKGAIENTKLRQSFADAITQQIRDNTLPATVGVRMEKNKTLLFLHRIPPPPPLRKPEEVLAEKLFQVLEAQRRLGGIAYPLSLRRLRELTDSGADDALLKKALAHPSLKGKLALVDVKNPDAPVALVEDRNQLISSGALLEFLLRKKRSSMEQAFPGESLVSKKSDLYRPFMEALERQVEAGSLPSTIGWMWVGKKKHLFFLEDVHGCRHATDQVATPAPNLAAVSPPTPRETPVDFARAFDEAFNQINRQNGAHNFVSLVELRRVLPLPPERFDAELRKLRVAGRYTLSAAEGRHGISPEERAAGITEDGSLLLYVSRKTP